MIASRARAAGLQALILLLVLVGPIGVARASIRFESTGFSIFSAPPAGSEPGAVGPLDMQAGSHPYDVEAAFTFNQTTDAEGRPVPDEAVKDLEVELPPGLLGNPTHIPQCPFEEFQSSSLFSQGCPQAAQVGTMKLETTLAKITLPVFNLEPAPGKAAQFGVYALISPMVMDVSVRSESDYGLRVTLGNLPQSLPVVGGVLNLWGVPADAGHDTLRGHCLGFEGQSLGECPAGVSRRPFLTLPVRCGEPPVVTFRMDSWERPGEFVSRSASPHDPEGHRLTLEGCDAIDFSPGIDVRPEGEDADSPAGVEIDLKLPQGENPDGLARAQLRDIALALPPGLTLDPAAADGLSSCTISQIGLGRNSPPACPESSRLGSVTVASSLTAEPLQGSIYLATPQQNPFGGMLAAYLVAEGSGVLVKIPAEILAGAGDGQLTVHLDRLPQLPFSEFSLRFDGGPRAPLALPPRCGSFVTSARLHAYSDPAESEPTVASSSFTVDRGCGGGFSPSFLGGATSSIAGHPTGLTLRLARGDGEDEIDRFSVVLPLGLLPLLSGIPSCPEPEARGGDCPQASRIASVAVAAGAGSHPFDFSGGAFITGPYKGAPFGLAIEVPATAGPFDLGLVVVRAQVLVDPVSARVTIVTDPLPRILQGIPLRIRSFELTTMARPGLFAAPTSCEQQELGARVVGWTGAVASPATPFLVDDCSSLQFEPRITAATAGHASRHRGASLRLTIRNRLGGQANLRSVAIGFPRQLSPRLSTIQGACPAAIFAAGPGLCPPTSAIGTARASTPIFESPLEGTAYLVSRSREALPRIVLVLTSRGPRLELVGSLHVSKRGASAVSFEELPDAPISRFAISLPSGPNSALGANFLHQANGTLCGHSLKLATGATAYNGARAKRTVRVKVTGCRKGAS